MTSYKYSLESSRRRISRIPESIDVHSRNAGYLRTLGDFGYNSTPPGVKAVHASPKDNLAERGEYVSAVAFLSKMWGYDFVISPEQSIPFAIGKLEVSTSPFSLRQ